jgi:hypothetical protein
MLHDGHFFHHLRIQVKTHGAILKSNSVSPIKISNKMKLGKSHQSFENQIQPFLLAIDSFPSVLDHKKKGANATPFQYQ